MNLEIDFRSGIPIYLQVVERIKERLASGQLKSGDQLPTVRSLAQELRLINPHPGTGMTSHRVRDAGPFTEYEFPRPAWDLARLEIIDHQGRKAWTSAFTL